MFYFVKMKHISQLSLGLVRIENLPNMLEAQWVRGG
jgi:hypothetical protein